MAWDNYPLYTDVMASPEFIAETSRTLRAELANFETPVDVEWEKDPSDLSEKSFRQFEKAKKQKFRW